MGLKLLVFSVVFIFLSGCEKQEHPAPEEKVKSYLNYSIDGQKYHLEHGNESQYVSYFYGEEQNNLFGYKLAVAGRDSTGNAPSFLIAIRNGAPVTKGVWKITNDFPPTSDVLMSWVHTQSKNPLVYRAYWSLYDGTIEITEVNDHKIKGVFSGTIQSEPNSYSPIESFKVTDGEFFVNRSPGYSDRDQH